MVDICQGVDISTFRMGFLKTPEYPLDYQPGMQCMCNITTDPDQKILMKFLDSNLEWSEDCDKDVVSKNCSYATNTCMYICSLGTEKCFDTMA